jgi:hypothetical protein
MRWLLIAFFVSLVGLLIAAAGMVLHVWLHRARNHSRPSAGARKVIDSPRSPAEMPKTKTKK